MVEMVDLSRDFDGPRDVCHYMDALVARGVPYEHIDENTIVVFDDEIDHEKWLELASAPDGLFEAQTKRQRLKSKIDELPDDRIDELIEELDSTI